MKTVKLCVIRQSLAPIVGGLLPFFENKVQGEIRTTVEYLVQLLETGEFKENNIDTSWLDGLIREKVGCASGEFPMPSLNMPADGCEDVSIGHVIGYNRVAEGLVGSCFLFCIFRTKKWAWVLRTTTAGECSIHRRHMQEIVYFCCLQLFLIASPSL